VSRAYYNEIEPYCVEWLKNLIAAGLIPNGDVDSRPIETVSPDDLKGYTQCHFFAGLGGWGYAVRLAGWPDDRPIWTGSCPCQPFSRSGRQQKTDDVRHLWPSFFGLIRARHPNCVVGEQVSGSAGEEWFDKVAFDLESEDYSARAVDIPACSIGADHVRPRLYWLAHSMRAGLSGSEPERDCVCGSAGTPPTERGYGVILARIFHEPSPASVPHFNGISRPVDCVHAFGNAIVPELAAEVIRAYMEVAGV
jgi:DNA (cytosine-5)-methyltransferase 1